MAKAKTYTMSDLAEYVSKKGGVSTKDARKIIKLTFEGVATGLKKNDRVAITGMGSFSKKTKPAQRGGKKAKNPFTGEEYITKPKPASTKVKFRPAGAFKGLVG
ncbi:MAG TPA: HU family DNA-binding protein [Candidatus Thermoplasmatota archaeon]|nr:HU family DNA-binding protein [Candidatus Thermoplasmatota archaeon]